MNRRALVLAGLGTLPAATVVVPVSAQRRRPVRQQARAKPAHPRGGRPAAQHVRTRIVTRTFRSLVPMVIPGTGTGPGPASVYPSTIRVSGFRQGRILNVRVTLLGLSHERPDNVDILLVAPGNVGIMIMSDAGLGTAVANVSLTFDQNAPGSLPTPLVTGVFQPSNFEVPADVLAPPAPAGVSGHSLTRLNNRNPNGLWRLFVFDDASSNVGSLAGWALQIRARARAPHRHRQGGQRR